MAIPAIPDIRELMESGMHFGHASGKWHPKMKPYIFATRDKLHIIDLEKTREQLTSVLTILEQRVRDGKTIILVGTKKQVGDKVKQMGERLHIPYVDVRWLGGTMTNFAEVQKSINRMKKLEEFLASDEADKMIKKERVMMENDLRRMHTKFGGLRDLNRKPDALFIIDPGHEHNAVKEGRHQGLEMFAVVDTNCDPSQVHHVIPANDDAPKALTIMMDLIEKTFASGQKMIDLKKDEAPVAEEVIEVKQDEVEAEELEVVEEKAKEEEVKHEKEDAPAPKEDAVEAKEEKKASKTTKK